MNTNFKCFKCGTTKKLRKCKKCGAIFCADCTAPITNSASPTVQEIITACLKCGSGDIIFQEDAPSKF